jgi:hypothetical protein
MRKILSTISDKTTVITMTATSTIDNFATYINKIDNDTIMKQWVFYVENDLYNLTCRTTAHQSMSIFLTKNGTSYCIQDPEIFISNHRDIIVATHKIAEEHHSLRDILSGDIGVPTFCCSTTYGWFFMTFSETIKIIFDKFKDPHLKTILFEATNNGSKTISKKVSLDKILSFVNKNRAKLVKCESDTGLDRLMKKCTLDTPKVVHSAQFVNINPTRLAELKAKIFLKYPLQRRLVWQAGDNYVEQLRLKRIYADVCDVSDVLDTLSIKD